MNARNRLMIKTTIKINDKFEQYNFSASVHTANILSIQNKNV